MADMADWSGLKKAERTLAPGNERERLERFPPTPLELTRPPRVSSVEAYVPSPAPFVSFSLCGPAPPRPFPRQNRPLASMRVTGDDFARECRDLGRRIERYTGQEPSEPDETGGSDQKGPRRPHLYALVSHTAGPHLWRSSINLWAVPGKNKPCLRGRLWSSLYDHRFLMWESQPEDRVSVARSFLFLPRIS